MTSVIFWCLLLGPGEIFSIEIEPEKYVDTLKKKLKADHANALGSEDASRLRLWVPKSPVPLDAASTLHEELQSVTPLPQLAQQLETPYEKLSTSLLGNAPGDCINIIIEDPRVPKFHGVKRPYDDEEPEVANKRIHEDLRNDWPSVAPSSLASKSNIQAVVTPRTGKPLFACGRPANTESGIPIVLLHPIFAQFADDIKDYVPTAQDNSFATNLSKLMRDFYNVEADRARVFRTLFRQYCVEIRAGIIEGTQYITDGHASIGPYVYIVTTAKNELGLGGNDACLQSGIYHVESINHMTDEEINRGSLPCIHIFYAGPYFGFAGSIVSENFVMNPLGPIIPLFGHEADTDISSLAARTFGALKKAVERLQAYYQNLNEPLEPLDPRPDIRFPYITHYMPYPTQARPNPTSLTFKYLRRHRNSPLFFQCRDLESGSIIAVKFVRRYSKEAHLICAEGKFAPILHGFEKLPGGWYMVVMENLDPTKYKRMTSSNKSIIRDAVKVRMTELHQKGYVHGDIRRSNLLVGPENRVMLLDFDWAGKIGEARYPPNVNPELDGFKRPKGAEDEHLITVEHDLAMVDLLLVDPPPNKQ